MNEWISVKDKLPESSEELEGQFIDVLVCTSRGARFVNTYGPNGFFHDRNLEIDNRTKDDAGRRVAYWMYLPELPE